jgi:microcystin-dependent protein
MPIGSIILWPTDNDLWTKDDAEEWMICDGRQLPDEKEYASLSQRIGTSFGGGDAYFNIPDLRATFVRGTNTAGLQRDKNRTFNDPNATGRTAMKLGGAEKDHVGSVQQDAFEKHNHNDNHPTQGVAKTADHAIQAAAFTTAVDTAHPTTHAFYAGQTGGDETRPINAYLNYLIRAK